MLRSSRLFDKDWYLSNNPDVAQAKADPLWHYLFKGGFEGRDPSPDFSSSWYLNAYEDVKLARVNPLVHYSRLGKKRGAQAITPARKQA
jgi:O-antigen biosynthesis protein